MSGVEPFVQPPGEPEDDHRAPEAAEAAERTGPAAEPSRDTVFRRPVAATETPEESAARAAAALED